MKIILQFFGTVFGTIGLVILHVGLTYLLPYPLQYINILFVFFILFLLKTESGIVVWLAFFSHFFIELYTTAVYGATLFAATISVLCMFWLYRYIFTNRSWYSTMILTFLTLLIYRGLYSLILAGSHLFGHESGSWSLFVRSYSWEILITTAVTTMLSILFFRERSYPSLPRFFSTK